jgi:GNAT superfamily N-acetyltransferase
MNVRKIPDTIPASETHGDRATPFMTIRPFTASDVDFVISRQLALYKSEYGFTSETWNAYLTGGVHHFVKNFDPGKDCMNILKTEGVPVGCIAITHVDAATAQLRFFFMEPEMRGRGGGHRLMNMAIDFCREKKYERVFLWTFSTLMAARHLYERKGFLLTDMHENTDWGEKILEERWDLKL